MTRISHCVHHLIAPVGKTLSVTLCHGAVGEVRGEDGHQTILIAVIEQVQEWTYQITVLAVFQRFQSYIIDGKETDLTEVAVLVFLLLEHRDKLVGINQLQKGFVRIAVIVNFDRIDKVREADEQLESTDGGCLAIAWHSSKDKSERSVRIADPSADTGDYVLNVLILLVNPVSFLNGCLIEPEKDLISVLYEESSSASRMLLVEHQAR